MKNLKSFTEFVNESTINAELDALINEGALASKANRDLGLYLSDIGAEDKDYEDLYQAIGDALGEDISNVMFVDSETNDEDPLQSKIYNYLSSHTNVKTNVETDAFKNSHGWQCMHDPKMNVVRLDDYGFVAFYFTAKSKF
jgi:hypothetical protein